MTSVTIPVWEFKEELDSALQEDVSDCAYRTFLSSLSPLKKASGKTEVQLVKELNEFASDTLRILKGIRPVTITKFSVDSVDKSSGSYRIKSSIAGAKAIPVNVFFEIY